MSQQDNQEDSTFEPNYQIYDGETGNFGLNPERSQFVRTQGLKTKVIAKEVKEKAQALENRINLLKTQEEQMLRKIQDTQNQASKLLKVKKRNKEKQKFKEELEKKRTAELKRRKEMIRKAKEDKERKMKEIKDMETLANKRKAKEVQSNLEKLKKRHQNETRKQQIQNMRTINDIREFEKTLSEKKERKLRSIKDSAKNRKFFEMARNEKNAGELGSRIEELEDKERTLMERLKETQAKHDEVKHRVEEINQKEVIFEDLDE